MLNILFEIYPSRSRRWRLSRRQGTTNCPVRGAKAGRGPKESSNATLTAGGGGPRHLPLLSTSHIDAPPLALNFWPWRLMRTRTSTKSRHALARSASAKIASRSSSTYAEQRRGDIAT